MDQVPIELAHQIRELASVLPFDMAQTLAAVLIESDSADVPLVRARVLASVSSPHLRAQIEQLMKLWQRTLNLNGTSIALALLAAAEAEEQHRNIPKLDLVWTGPDSNVIPLRRTDQALLQLIQSATARILIVSFAVYKLGALADAIAIAARNKVTITICLESERASEGKIAYDTLRALGSQVVEKASIFVWPLDQRPRATDGRFGSLHPKVAVADSQVLLLSSANLTDYAFTLNMELGILIRGGTIPGKVERHFGELIAQGVLKQISAA